MITLIVIVLIIINFLVCRWVDKKIKESGELFGCPVFVWFVPVVGMVTALAVYFTEYVSIADNLAKNKYISKIFNLDVKEKKDGNANS